MVKGNNTLHFYYDSNNSPIAFTRNNTMYYYVKNIQGDIIKIVSEDGSLAYTYDYDAWGALLSIKDNQGNTISGNSLATTNPLRYRGYVYDDETGLYYLQSRYYDPKTGRFLNADVYFDTESGSPLSTNMFAYCENNLKWTDPHGTFIFRKIEIAVEWVDLRIYRSGCSEKCEVYLEVHCGRNIQVSGVRYTHLLIKSSQNAKTSYKNIRTTKSRYRSFSFPAGTRGNVRITTVKIPKTKTMVWVSIKGVYVYRLTNGSGWYSCMTFPANIL